MARYSDEHVKTIRERMRNDMAATFREHGGEDSIDWDSPFLDALVEDGMHPLEKIIAEENFYDSVQRRQ